MESYRLYKIGAEQGNAASQYYLAEAIIMVR